MFYYLARRSFVMLLTLVAISVLVFTIIQLPEGDYLTAYIVELQSQGEAVEKQKIEFCLVRKMYIKQMRKFWNCSLKIKH